MENEYSNNLKLLIGISSFAQFDKSMITRGCLVEIDIYVNIEPTNPEIYAPSTSFYFSVDRDGAKKITVSKIDGENKFIGTKLVANEKPVKKSKNSVRTLLFAEVDKVESDFIIIKNINFNF